MPKSLTVVLPENLTMSGVEMEQLHQDLEGVIQQEKTVVFDASQVTRADTAGLQLVSGLIIELEKQGKTYRWNGVSDVFRNAVRLLGLEAKLQLANNDSQK